MFEELMQLLAPSHRFPAMLDTRKPNPNELENLFNRFQQGEAGGLNFKEFMDSMLSSRNDPWRQGDYDYADPWGRHEKARQRGMSQDPMWHQGQTLPGALGGVTNKKPWLRPEPRWPL